ncbi:hypothetical protein [Sphingobacterium arenae]|uniref:Uncharacterized protein n=1 Tax=Sphingobacterium arenae TaxID=1280598 RepID=A0ABR7Y469_9SPHI|nr:hypothetical protein [Sphingobacterium arenae]MBD1426108.1 hypothetical protein [Sphingobacterium arenae]
MNLILLEPDILQYFKKNLSYAALVKGISNTRFMIRGIAFLFIPYIVFCCSFFVTTNYSNSKWALLWLILLVGLFGGYLWWWVTRENKADTRWLERQEVDAKNISFRKYFLECQLKGLREYLTEHEILHERLTLLIERLEKRKTLQARNILFGFIFFSAILGYTNADLQVISSSIFVTERELRGAMFHFGMLWMIGIMIFPVVMSTKNVSYGRWLLLDRVVLLLKEIELERREGKSV